MTIKEQLLEDYKIAIHEKDTLKKDTIQGCRAAILQVEKDQKCELDASSIQEIISKEYKKRAETLPELGDREDILTRYKTEMEILKKYLPEQLTEQALTEIIIQTIEEVHAQSMRDLGNVMKAIQPKIKGKADGKLVNTIVRKQLGS